MGISCIINEPIGKDIICSLLSSHRYDTSAGGISFFIGQVRDDITGNKKVKAIEYSANISLADVEVKKIISELLLEFEDVRKVEIIHSSGVVKAGEISLMIMVFAGHHQQATSACNRAIELVKERLPVWKKEIFDDDSHLWK